MEPSEPQKYFSTTAKKGTSRLIQTRYLIYEGCPTSSSITRSVNIYLCSFEIQLLASSQERYPH